MPEPQTRDEQVWSAGLAIESFLEQRRVLQRQRSVLRECHARHGLDALECTEHAPVFTELCDLFERADEVFQAVVGDA